MLYSFHRERDAVAAVVNLNHSDLHMLMQLHYVERMCNAAVGHLGDMHQSVLMDADIHEGTEVGDVRDDAWQHHSLHKVVDGGDILVELKLL